MDTKKLLVSLSLAVLAIFMVATVSASSSDPALASSTSIEVDGVSVLDNPAVIAGDTIVVSVEFTANVSASDVSVKVVLEGNKVDAEVVSTSFDVEAGQTYKKSLKITVPSELKDEISDDIDLIVKIWNGDYQTETTDTLRVQRESYNPEVKSVTVSQSVTAGDSFPVSVVLKNMGYNDLEDTYVTVAISELGVYKTAYVGDLINLESVCNSNDDNCDDTVSAELYLEVPYSAEAGEYTLVVEVANDDVISSVTKTIVVNNDFSSDVITTSTSKTVSVGESAEYTLLLVNPTNDLKVYTITSESNSQVSSDVESVVAVPAGSSKTVTVTAQASEAGEYNFNVNVFSGSSLDSTVALTLNAEAKNTTNPVVVLTVVLAIIFLVLLVVLIVLLGKKPAKTEEFGESYY